MPANAVVSPHPDISTIGLYGAYYFLREPTWITRCVETIEIESEVSGRRRLTVDIELPVDPRVIVDTHDGRALFCVPIALLPKHPPTAQIDVRDEAGNVLPLLTRAENGWISSIALRAAMQAGGATLYPEFENDLTDVVFADPDLIDPAIAAALMMEEIDPQNPAADRLMQVIEDLAVCSVLWVHLWGAPGERRVVKLCYAISLDRPPLVLRREEEVELTYSDGVHEFTFPTTVLGAIRWRDTIARLRSPVANALGWSSVDVLVNGPDLRGDHSYHMQVIAPEGLALTGIDTDGDDDAGRHCDGMRAHLYLSEADGLSTGPIRFALKVERRGFLNLSLMATVVTASGLWLAQATAGAAQQRSVNQISAAVLLVLPALLAVFVIRQAEHPIATRLLAGVRALVLLAGLASVGAAAALSGIKPAMWQTVSEAWIWCATVASLAAIGVGIAWLRSFETVRPFKPRHSEHGPTAYLARVTLIGLIVIGLCAAVRMNTLSIGEAEPLAIGLLLIAALAASIVMVSPTRFAARLLRCVCLVYALVAVAVAAVTATTHSDMRNDIALGAGALATAALILAAVSRLRRDP